MTGHCGTDPLLFPRLLPMTIVTPNIDIDLHFISPPIRLFSFHHIRKTNILAKYEISPLYITAKYNPNILNAKISPTIIIDLYIELL